MYPQASSSCENIRTGSAGDCSHELKVVGDKLIVTIDGCEQKVTLPSGGGGSAATCASISALFNTPMTATMATKFFTSGCGTVTLADVKSALVAGGDFGDKQNLAIVGTDLKISVTDSLVSLSKIVAGGLAAPMSIALKDALSGAMATALSAPVAPGLNTAITAVVNNALGNSTALTTQIDSAIAGKVNCAFVSGLYPASVSPITGFEKLLSADCKSIDIDALTLYVGENATVLPANIEPGALPATVKVSCANLTVAPGAPAVGDRVITAGCKSVAMRQMISATGRIMNDWVLAA